MSSVKTSLILGRGTAGDRYTMTLRIPGGELELRNEKGENMLYEVAVIQKPTKEEAEHGESEKLIAGPVAVIAKDAAGAAFAAAKFAPDFTIDVSRCEVLVRPFA